MSMIACLALGAVAGVLARALRERPLPGGLAGTIVVGVVGAIVGAALAPAIGIGELRPFFQAGTWLLALASAVAFLRAYTAILDREPPRDESRDLVRFR
jgi:uncharacterized membrane protein YeaQ/YmgE (transglycosylase-associated protein family)